MNRSLFLVGLLIFLALPQGIRACSPPVLPPLGATPEPTLTIGQREEATARSIRQSFANADLVFRGRVVNITYPRANTQTVTFDVNRRWKGSVSEKVVVTDEDYYGQGSLCAALLFRQSEEYIVYAFIGNDGIVHNGLFSGTHIVDGKNDEIEVLGPGTPIPVPTPIATPTPTIPIETGPTSQEATPSRTISISLIFGSLIAASLVCVALGWQARRKYRR